MSDETDLPKIARFVADQEESSRLVKRLGFPSGGEIERFILRSYGKAIAQMKYADRLRGHMFVLEPATSEGQIADPGKLVTALKKVKESEQSSVLAIPLDLGKAESTAVSLKKADFATKVSGSWLSSHAQALSESLDKCVVIASGVTASIFVSGKLYFELGDVIEGLDKGPQEDFQKLSWEDGAILYFFAEHDLNDRSPIGIWRLPDKFVLKPNPETLIEARLYSFLRYRMRGMVDLVREAHVENDGRLDLSLQLTNGFFYIVEIKWMGSSLKKTEQQKTNKEIENALKTGEKWFTDFDESVIDQGLKQVVIYCAGGTFQKGYSAVFDCQTPDKSKTERNIAIKLTDGQDPSKFKIIRAAVDPRSASVRSKS